MSPLKTTVRVAVLAAALPLSGCAAMFGGYDLAPNGLPRPEDALRRDLAFQPDEAYHAIIEGHRELPDDDLLRLLYAGTAGRYAGAYGESSHLLDLASYVAEDRVTTSVSREVLSMVTSDRALAYVPSRTERLMIPYVAAVAFLEAGDTGGAAVEARRIEALLDRLGEAGNGRSVSADARFLHLFAASVFEAAGDFDAADVAYRRAGLEGREEVETMAAGEPIARADSPAGLEAGYEAGTEQDAGPDATAAIQLASTSGDTSGSGGAPGISGAPGAGPSGEGTGEVVVLVERGFVPHQVEQSVMIVLPGWQVNALTDGDAGERALAATEAAARILLTANYLYGDRSGYGRDASFRTGIRLDPWGCDMACPRPVRDSGAEDPSDEDDSDDTVPYLLRISWPVLFEDRGVDPSLRILAGGATDGTTGVAASADARFDVAAGVRRDFESQRAATIARTVARAASKLALSAGAKAAVGEKDEAAGHVVGFLANLGTMLTERADTRSWHLLPGSVSMVRMRLPAGTHELELEVDGTGRTVPVGSVEVRPGRTAVVTHRIWR